jgi:hypothetical protein
MSPCLSFFPILRLRYRAFHGAPYRVVLRASFPDAAVTVQIVVLISLAANWREDKCFPRNAVEKTGTDDLSSIVDAGLTPLASAQVFDLGHNLLSKRNRVDYFRYAENPPGCALRPATAPASRLQRPFASGCAIC